MIPKSLHTVTAISNLATYFEIQCMSHSPADAIEMAAKILGYHGVDDSYGLKAKALAIVEKREEAIHNARVLQNESPRPFAALTTDDLKRKARVSLTLELQRELERRGVWS